MTDLRQLLAGMEPDLQPGEYVFLTIPMGHAPPTQVAPLGMFMENEGCTLILDAASADALDYSRSAPMRQISLKIHSSLEAIGLTAAISAELSGHGISANVVAAYYHDHIFVPAADAERAVEALRQLSLRSARR